MMTIQEMQLKNGSVLVSITGYCGETDFYAMYDIIKELLAPEHITYGVDSMCVDGSFRKDGTARVLASRQPRVQPRSWTTYRFAWRLLQTDGQSRLL